MRACVCLCLCLCVCQGETDCAGQNPGKEGLAPLEIKEWLCAAVDNRNPAQPLAETQAESSISLSSPLPTHI